MLLVFHRGSRVVFGSTIGCALLLLTLGAAPARAVVPHRLVEEFNATTYKDVANTTADWNTAAGKLKLFPFQPTLLGSDNTPGAVGMTVSGTLAYVTINVSGLRILNVSNPASPTLLGSYNTPGDSRDVAVSGTVAYVADVMSGLTILDVSNPASPTLLGSYNTPAFAQGVAVSGTVVYVADGASGLQILDVSNPASPTLLGSYDTPDLAIGVAVSGTVVYVADASSGLQVLDVSNPASPTLLGSYDTPGLATGVAVSGTVAYVTDSASGLQILDVSSPASPTLLGSYNTPGSATGVEVSGTVAYVADFGSGVQILDVSNPASPILLGSYDTPGGARKVVVSGTTAFVADFGSGVQILNVSSLVSPALVGSFDTPGYANRIALSGTVAYVADGVSGLHIVDAGNPASPTLLGSYDTPGTAWGIAVSGTVVYVADYDSGGVQILDVSNPASPTLLGSYDTPDYALGIAVSGTVAYVADGNSGVQILDVSNPASPTLLGSYDTPGTAWGIAVSGTVAYVADDVSGLQILDVSNPASPTLLGGYDTPGQAFAVEVSGTVAYVADGLSGVQILNVSNPASPTLLGSYDTPVYANQVAVLGTVAYVVDAASGLLILNVSNPASPILLGSYNTPGNATSVQVSGTVAYVADLSSGLLIVEVMQNRFDLAPNVGRSLAIDGTSDVIARGRLTSTQVNTVNWELSANGGTNWQAAVPGGPWVAITSGSDLTWRATLAPIPPYLTAAGPEASRVEVEWLYSFAVIDSITDVGNDQGGRVRLHFTRSGHDFADEASSPVTGYQIYHRVDDAMLLSRIHTDGIGSRLETPLESPWSSLSASMIRRLADRTFVVSGESVAGTFPPGTWEAVGWVAATQSDAYTALIPTTADSSTIGIAWSTYLVTTHTTTPSVWFESYTDSGYSVDNLAPGVPPGFTAMQAGAAVDLDWQASQAADFQYFRIYRGTTPGFAIGPSSHVHSTAGLAWTDPAPGSGTVYYKLTALDHAGNEGGPASASANVTVGVDDARAPAAFALHRAAPNPFQGVALIRYDVPAGDGAMRLDVYDVAGRLVRTLVEGVQSPGAKSVAWDGRGEGRRALPAGVYLCRMQAAGFSQTLRLMLTR